MHTGYVSPQYHVVFDSKFETVFNNGKSSAELDKICAELFVSSRECFVEDEYDEDHPLMKYGYLSLNGVSDGNFWKSSAIVLLGNELLNLVKSRSVLSAHGSLYQLWRSPTSTAMMKILCLVVQTSNLEER